MSDLRPYLEKVDALSLNTIELEKELEAAGEAERGRLRELGAAVRRLHVSCLYCRADASRVSAASYDAWKAIVKKIGSTPNDWRELGFFLGVDPEDLDYIAYGASGDKTDLVLRVCVEREDATLAHVTSALLSMERYDVLKVLEPPFLEIAQIFCKRSASCSDAGYHSLSGDSESSIIKPQNITNELPEALKHTYVSQAKQLANPHRNPAEPPPTKYADMDNDKPKVFLTFAEDGIECAQTIRNLIDRWSEEQLQVQVLTLNDRKNDVFLNPYNAINNIIQQVDYVIPIVTEQYMRSVSAAGAAEVGDPPASSDCVDARYARYVLTQLTHSYIFVDGCSNKKVRCVVPQGVDRSLLSCLNKYPVLLPWTCEVDFDREFKGLLKKAQKRYVKKNYS